MGASYTGGRVALTTHLSVDPSVSVNRVRLPAGHFTTRLYRARVDYAFSPWMFVSALLQYHSAEQSVGSNLRVRWEYRPGSEFFAVLLYPDPDVPPVHLRALHLKSDVARVVVVGVVVVAPLH